MKNYPDYIVVAGGGRWGRVLTSELCKFIPEVIKIIIYSPGCAGAMSKWVAGEGLQDKVSCTPDFPILLSEFKYVMVVVNSVRNHFEVSKKALENKIPILVEKPVTSLLSEFKYLSNLSLKEKVFFAPAHVFLFTEYLNDFSKLVSTSEKIAQIKINWSDLKNEERYGEVKSFDPSLPVYVDLVPHILSILSFFVPVESCVCEKLDFLLGGSQLILNLRIGEVLCSVELTRNGCSRKRSIEVNTDSDFFYLDFAKEPGKIWKNSVLLSDNFKKKEMPVGRMLGAFLDCSVNKELDDKRLDLALALYACKLSDEIKTLYNNELEKWLSLELREFEGYSESLKYGISEILQEDGVLSTDLLNRMLGALSCVLNKTEDFSCLMTARGVNSYRTLVKDIGQNNE